MVFLNFLICLLMLASCRSATPVDVVDSAPFQSGRLQISEDDLIYADNAKPLPDMDKDFSAILANVVGRGSPSREGKALFRLKKGERVRVLNKSTDGRWVAIHSVVNNRKAWVPVNVLQNKTSKEEKK
jgi:hypothetical protein